MTKQDTRTHPREPRTHRVRVPLAPPDTHPTVEPVPVVATKIAVARRGERRRREAMGVAPSWSEGPEVDRCGRAGRRWVGVETRCGRCCANTRREKRLASALPGSPSERKKVSTDAASEHGRRCGARGVSAARRCYRAGRVAVTVRRWGPSVATRIPRRAGRRERGTPRGRPRPATGRGPRRRHRRRRPSWQSVSPTGRRRWSARAVATRPARRRR